MRSVLVLGVLAALAGCSSVDRNADAATVEDGGVTVDAFQSMLREVVANPEVFGIEEDTATGTVEAAPGRQVLSLMVQSEASSDFLEGAGQPVTDDDRQAVRDELGEDSPLFEQSDEMVSLFVDLDAATAARARIEAPDSAELERRYTASPEQLGVMCVRHVVVETEAEAEDVLSDLRHGGDIAAIAAERSIDPQAATTGGALESGERACLGRTEASQGTDPLFVAAAVQSAPGRPVGPVETSFGWHVIEARPYDEVAESLEELYAEQAGELLFAGFLASADITVDPRYGRWDGASVVEL